MIQEIEKLRQKLNDMVDRYDCGSSEVLEVSREMDILLLTYLQDSLPCKEQLT